MKPQSSFFIGIGVLSIWLWPSAVMAQQPITIRLGHVGFPGSLLAIVADEYANRVNAGLKGKVKVKLFRASQLGTDEQMIRRIKLGTQEMFIPSTIMSTVEPKFGVFEMPYIIVSRAHMKKVSESKKLQNLLLGGLPAKGLRILAVWENGFRHVTNNVRPIVKPEDLKGIKLRVPSGVWRVKMFKAYGADPSPIPFAELYSALQSGVVDGQENPLAQIWSAKLYGVQKFLSLTGHVYTPAYLVVSEDFWKKLPNNIRTALAKTAWQLGDFARAQGARLDTDLLEKLTPRMKTNEVDRDAFIKVSAHIFEQFGEQVPEASELIKLIQSLR